MVFLENFRLKMSKKKKSINKEPLKNNAELQSRVKESGSVATPAQSFFSHDISTLAINPSKINFLISIKF